MVHIPTVMSGEVACVDLDSPSKLSVHSDLSSIQETESIVSAGFRNEGIARVDRLPSLPGHQPLPVLPALQQRERAHLPERHDSNDTGVSIVIASCSSDK